MNGKLRIERLMTPAECAPGTTDAERAEAAAFGSEQRRREYLTWRAVVRCEVGADARIGYDALGAPVVENYPVHIGVAHCPGWVAVCISDKRCAVDIERTDRDFGRAASRYMTFEEQALAGDPLLPAAVWCAKEVLYKYAGRRGLDLLRDLRVERADLGGGTLAGRICGGEPIAMSLCRTEEYLAVYIL